MHPPLTTVQGLGSAIRQGEVSATDTLKDCLQHIRTANSALNCFTSVLHERALARAAHIDTLVAQGKDPGPLAGVPFSVKNLFDITGLATLAGSKINRKLPPASADAVLISRLEAAGAVLVGAVAMGEYAYDFTGENSHYGACRNPWDHTRMSGGSSSGSGTSVGAGLVPLSLGSDTNGSIRVPASLCGIYGLKPTYGRLPRSGTFPFCDSLDHLGPLARTVTDLALAFDYLQGYDAGDAACTPQPALATTAQLQQGIEGLRMARAGGWFDCSAFPEAAAAVDQICRSLSVTKTLPLEGAAEGRAAAYLITNAESALLHRQNLLTRAGDFDPDTRDRFFAGNLFPATWYIRAQQVRRHWLQQMLAVFSEIDILIAPCTPCSAPLIGTKTLMINGVERLLRPNLGLFTQPFSAIGLPVCSIPLWLPGARLPIGVQLVAPPWREDLCLRVAYELERTGVSLCRLPSP